MHKKRDWTRLEASAKRDLQRNKALIEASATGLPSARASQFRLRKPKGDDRF